jgi:transcriptional regulator with XRE-family HTH domain
VNDTHRIVDTLKRLIRSRGLTYADVAPRVGLSEASVKRLFSRSSFTLAQLARFCEALDVDLYELARLARGREGELRELTEAQESALAADPRLLALFWLVLNGWTRDEVLARHAITAAQCTSLLVRLDRLGLIELLPGDRVRLKVPRALRLRSDGPIRRVHGRKALDDFLAPRFDEAGGYFAFEFRELSPASVEILRRKLERLASEFHELAELDSRLPPAARRTIGLALGIRPWSLETAVSLGSPRPPAQKSAGPGARA